MARIVLLFLLAGGGLWGQCQAPENERGSTARFILTFSATGTSEKITVQQPASGAGRVTMECAYVFCTNACTVTFSRDGTAATATALTPVWINEAQGSVSGFRSSDVGSGTTISPAFNVTPGAPGQTFTLATVLGRASTANNWTLTLSQGVSGAYQVLVQGRQQ